MATTTTHRIDFEESGIITAIVGGIVAAVTGLATGVWQWLSNRKKLGIDAQASLVTGFVSLLTSVQNERDRLLARIDVLEAAHIKQDNRIVRLERVLRKHNIEVPNGE